jgi:hypothetical protein
MRRCAIGCHLSRILGICKVSEWMLELNVSWSVFCGVAVHNRDAGRIAGLWLCMPRRWRTLAGCCLRLAGRHAGQVRLLRRDDLLAGVARSVDVQQLLVDLQEAVPPAAATVATSSSRLIVSAQHCTSDLFVMKTPCPSGRVPSRCMFTI